ncbi:MAG: hypothetical protein ABIQ00_14815 [Chitinophagaceae bacterium]
MAIENFTPEESIKLIQNMIEKTRQRFSDQGHYFLLWGWCTFLALLGQFVLIYFFKSPYHYMVWLITFVCMFITIYWTIREDREKKATTYVKESMRYLWTGLGITFFIFCLIFVKLGWWNCYPFYITLYGVGTFVSGKILQFKPLVWGGIISWILAAVSVWFHNDVHILFAAVSILVSYIIPGHLLKFRYRTQ